MRKDGMREKEEGRRKKEEGRRGKGEICAKKKSVGFNTNAPFIARLVPIG